MFRWRVDIDMDSRFDDSAVNFNSSNFARFVGLIITISIVTHQAPRCGREVPGKSQTSRASTGRRFLELVGSGGHRQPLPRTQVGFEGHEASFAKTIRLLIFKKTLEDSSRNMRHENLLHPVFHDRDRFAATVGEEEGDTGDECPFL